MLVIDYQWGSMGSDETAITVPGGPRVIDVFDGNDGRRDFVETWMRLSHFEEVFHPSELGRALIRFLPMRRRCSDAVDSRRRRVGWRAVTI